jgi:hypothetical protein
MKSQLARASFARAKEFKDKVCTSVMLAQAKERINT